MKNLLSWFFLIIFFSNCFSTDVFSVYGQCQSDQRSLLIQIKNSLVFDPALSVNLPRWNQNTDCCYWRGVGCDEAGLVTSLNLSNESISGGIDKATGLYALQHLKSLNLAYNRFHAIQIPSRLADLTKLNYLNLSNAGFAGQIPIEISNMARLVTLDLSCLSYYGSSLDNQNLSSSLMEVETLNLSTSSLQLQNPISSTIHFKLEIPTQSTPSLRLGNPQLKLKIPNLSLLIQNLTQLRELYLDGVNISAHGSEWCKALSSSLSNLQVLSLSNCFLSGPITPSFAELRSLSVIRLDQNNLSSKVPIFLAEFMNLTSLRLSSCGLSGTFPEDIFQLPTLETLDISYNGLLEGSLRNFPQNQSLRTLILKFTNFSGTLPDSISNLKNLSRIELSNCNFTGVIPTSMGNLSHIVYLDLSSNKFTGPIPTFHMTKNLSYLDLSRNLLIGAIPSSWKQLQNLTYVDLSLNSLDGNIPPSLFAISSLQKLQLANNQIEGQVPDFPDAYRSLLDTLDLSGNRLEGPVPISVFKLHNLKILVLSSNNFSGTIHLDSIQGLRHLTKLELSYNRLVVNGSDYSFLTHISTLRLASCNLRVIPDLKNQSKLYILDLSDNQISGEVPNWIWEVGNGGLVYLNLSHNLLVSLQEPLPVSNHFLEVLDLHSNQLQGKMPYPPLNVVYVDYSSNDLNFTIPANIGKSLSSTIFFSLSNNSLTGFIPESICNATYLKVLDLSDNSLNGIMPTCLIKRTYPLGILNLRRNKLTGTIRDAFPENCALQTLNLNRNRLGGKIPKSLAKCKMLEVLDLGNNHINDNFPCWLKEISTFRVLVLRSNKFYGTIGCPDQQGNWSKLQILDLAINNFDGTLPGKCLATWKAMTADEDEEQSQLKHIQFPFLQFGYFYYQDAVTVTIKGLEMELVKILNVFTSIDLSGNNFGGSLPEETGLLKSVRLLNVSRNALTGPIPSSIGNLKQLESLDLSANQLDGVIPIKLASLSFLSVLNLSNNHLEGRIPSGPQLQTFSASSFEGNEGLCGPPLTNNCTRSSNQSQPLAPASSKEFDWLFIVIGIGFGMGSAVVIAPLMFSDKVNQWYDDHIIDDFRLVILPMFGLLYKTSHQRRIKAEEDLKGKNSDEDEDDYNETVTEETHSRYCVLCSKLDIAGNRTIHDPRCIHHSLPISSSSTSLAH
ncbi:receptor-like protein 33 [Mangifera indica]|uniref:receptor-like protein 33 n=1 Tax=Mangifera indica TaxID=29780 RepID=UPI001CFB6246|nr:receptor-like protein 33 [Mangifera indica]